MFQDRNFKMSKQSKITLANNWNHPQRGAMRKTLIQAEIASRQVVKSKKDGGDRG